MTSIDLKKSYEKGYKRISLNDFQRRKEHDLHIYELRKKCMTSCDFSKGT